MTKLREVFLYNTQIQTTNKLMEGKEMRDEEMNRSNGKKWLYGILAGTCIAAMNVGVSLLQTNLTTLAILSDVAEGVLVCSLTIICGGIIEWLLAPAPEEPEICVVDHPARLKANHYSSAFRSLAKTFTVQEAVKSTSKMELLWNDRLMENRAAVADQLNEMADIMVDTVARTWKIQMEEGLEQELKMRLKQMGIQVHAVFLYEKENKRQELYITMKAGKRKCVATKDVAAAVGKILGRSMMPAKDSRTFVGNDYGTQLFVESTTFKVLYGVEKKVKHSELISGDSFSFYEQDEGQFTASLSDGMGSGIAACQESELVVDLLEQFLEAGFTKETAVKMINSALVIRSDAKIFSTIDMSSIDLYSGVCDFLKVGASTTFILRDHWVETITSTSLPAGVFHKLDLDTTSKKLYDGDMVIMITDGILDALPMEHQEKVMKDIIMEHKTNNPKELASYILNRVLQYGGKKPVDDMTVLVVGIWKK